MGIHFGSAWNSPLQVKLFSLKKFSLLNLNEAWIAINSWSSSSLLFLSFSLALCCYQIPGTSSKENTQQPWHGGEVGCPTREDVWDIPRRTEGRRKGEEERAWGLSLWHGACWLDSLETLGEISLNRHENWILFNLIIQVLLILGFLIT